MEFLLWLWIWDKRLLICLDHGNVILVYIWLVPLLITLGFFGLTLWQVVSDPVANCSGIDTSGLEFLIKLQLAF